MLDWINRLKTPMESQKGFYKNIEDYYAKMDSNIPHALKNRLYYNIAYKIHNEYRDRRLKYPKSLNRYSRLKIDDLEHDYNKWYIIDFIKKELPNEYRIICSKLFNMNIGEYELFEKRRRQFEDVF